MTSETLKSIPPGFASPSGSEPSADIPVPLPLPEQSVHMVGPQETYPTSREVLIVIDYLKKQVAAKRIVSIKKRVEKNKQKLDAITCHLFKSSTERSNSMVDNDDRSINLLLKKQKDAIDMQNDFYTRNGVNDINSSQENSQNASEVLLVGANIPVRNPVRAIKIREVKRVPPYTTWIFLHRNQRMAEDQSVVGRRRIYYDQSGGEALICSDSEEEVVEDDEEKKEFVEPEDYILRMTIKEVGFSDVVLELLAQCFGRKTCEVKARFETLTKGEKRVEDVPLSANPFLDKDVDAALDSFDNLFCRRCLVFDCKLHGCSQDLVFPAEKQQQWNCPQEESVSCGLHCYRLALSTEHIATSPASSDIPGVQKTTMKNSNPFIRSKSMSSQSESTSSNTRNISEGSDPEIRPMDTKIVMKDVVPKRNSKRVADRILAHMMKKQKKLPALDSDCTLNVNEDSQSSPKKAKFPIENKNSNEKKSVPGEASHGPSNELINCPLVPGTANMLGKEHVDESICKQEFVDCKSWKNIEKSLFEKGVDIFGRNSCLIARNLMMGMKTCFEVFQYMNFSTNMVGQADGASFLMDGYSNCNENMGNEVRRKKFLRRRGKVRRLKYTWKSAGYHSIRKRISERKDLPCRQFNPCGCESGCGKQCSCLLTGTCCEKYCGCPKSCKNRFRGCHCAKSQCRSRQCPCFAADRECDPDVCRNCWVSCGDGTLGVPSQRGDNYECRNMKLLLKQQQRVLLGRSDVSGWGAFLKNSVAKNEYLGEYTGELISHREADKRGKIYDRENSSFLFNLNDQFVLDAFRKGDKLKFANHSPDPNCYAKVMMVAGDHRVGIFAKERINAGEELFYDYRYEADRAPAWARKPEASGIRKDECTPSTGRAKKVA